MKLAVTISGEPIDDIRIDDAGGSRCYQFRKLIADAVADAIKAKEIEPTQRIIEVEILKEEEPPKEPTS